MNAKEEFRLERLTFHSPHGTETVSTCPDWAAAMDLIDRLRAENAELRNDGRFRHGYREGIADSIVSGRWINAEAERDALRVALVKWRNARNGGDEIDEAIAGSALYKLIMDADEPCRVYWGSHGCALPRGHDGHHDCGCCTCLEHPDVDGGCVGRFPYYGPDTRFYGEDADGSADFKQVERE